MMKPNYDIKNNIFFKINKEKVIIIGKFEFIIFDPILLEVQTMVDTGLICGVLPFNKENNDYDETYHYFSLIIWENENFYLKIYSIFDYIKETEKINLNQFCPEFEKLIIENNISKFYKSEESIKEEKEEDYYRKYIEFEDYMKENEKNNKEYSLFDMFYDVKDNENIILIIDITTSSIENKNLQLSLEINLNNSLFE